MDAAELRAMQAPIKDRYKEDPSAAVITLKAKGSTDTEGLTCKVETGRALFHRRQGQLNLSCSQCHDDNWGKSLAGNPIPQAHPTGYPLYRLEWQGLGSLQRRLRNCLTGMRAEPFEYGAPEYIALEIYLATRAAPLPLETPAVRP